MSGPGCYGSCIILVESVDPPLERAPRSEAFVEFDPAVNRCLSRMCEDVKNLRDYHLFFRF